MRVEPLGLEHQELLDERLRTVHVGISEYSFPNLYLFRRVHDYEVVHDEELLIRGRTYSGHRYLMPTRDVREMDPAFIKEKLREVDFLFPIPEEWLAGFSPDDYVFSATEGESDYVYTVEKLSTLRGRRLHAKRNLVKQFTETYSHEARPLTTDRLDDAGDILEAWQRGAGDEPDRRDYYPCREALRLYDQLRLCGGIYYAEGEPAGFVIGEEVNPETFVLHFAKARTEFKGIYQFMFNNFAGVLPARYRFINFEQDLDKPALRLAKLSFIPDLMIKKHRIGLKQPQSPSYRAKTPGDIRHG